MGLIPADPKSQARLAAVLAAGAMAAMPRLQTPDTDTAAGMAWDVFNSILGRFAASKP